MTDPHGHLDLDALADVLAGERDDPHLRSCAACADRLADLAAAEAPVAAALGALPAPPMPDGLAARLERALGQERQGELTAVRSLRRPARRAPAWLPAVAASAALVMAGAVGWSLLDASGPQSADTASEAGSDTSSGGGGGDGGGGGGEGDDSAAAPEAATGLAAPLAGSATDWADEAARPAAVTRLLSATGAFDARATAAPSVAGLDRLRDPAALAACLANLPAGDDDVLAVDYAQYDRAPAVAVLQATEPGLVRVTVVGSGCSASDPDLLGGTVLPRP